MARVPVASPWGPNPQLGVRRPDRSVSLDDARNPESVADARLLAQLMAASPDEGWLDPSQERSLRTAGEIMRPIQLHDLGMSGMMGMVPLPLPGGAAGRGIAKGVGKGARGTDDLLRTVLRWLRKGDDVVDEVADLTQPMLPGVGRVPPTPAPSQRPMVQMQHGRPQPNTVARPGAAQPELFPPSGPGLAATGRGSAGGTRRPNVLGDAETQAARRAASLADDAAKEARIADPGVRARWLREATESTAPIRVGDDAAKLPHGARVNLDEVIETGMEGAGGRMIVQVKLADGTYQPFYRRSGTGTGYGIEGDWRTFEGLQADAKFTHPTGFISDRGWLIKPSGHDAALTGELAEIAQSLKAYEKMGQINPTRSMPFVVSGSNEVDVINVLLRRTGRVG